jgi:hypothetical protein
MQMIFVVLSALLAASSLASSVGNWTILPANLYNPVTLVVDTPLNWTLATSAFFENHTYWSRVLQTTDGGESWSTLWQSHNNWLIAFLGKTGDAMLLSLYNIPDATVFTSMNSGRNWTKTPLPPHTAVINEGLRSITTVINGSTAIMYAAVNDTNPLPEGVFYPHGSECGGYFSGLNSMLLGYWTVGSSSIALSIPGPPQLVNSYFVVSVNESSFFYVGTCNDGLIPQYPGAAIFFTADGETFTEPAIYPNESWAPVDGACWNATHCIFAAISVLPQFDRSTFLPYTATGWASFGLASLPEDVIGGRDVATVAIVPGSPGVAVGFTTNRCHYEQWNFDDEYSNDALPENPVVYAIATFDFGQTWSVQQQFDGYVGATSAQCLDIDHCFAALHTVNCVIQDVGDTSNIVMGPLLPVA